MFLLRVQLDSNPIWQIMLIGFASVTTVSEPKKSETRTSNFDSLRKKRIEKKGERENKKKREFPGDLFLELLRNFLSYSAKLGREVSKKNSEKPQGYFTETTFIEYLLKKETFFITYACVLPQSLRLELERILVPFTSICNQLSSRRSV